MGKSRSGRSGRGGRNPRDHDGQRRNPFEHFELDTDMANGPRPYNEQQNHNQAGYSGFYTHYDDISRNGAGRAFRAVPQAPHSNFTICSQTQRPPPARRNPFLTPSTTPNPFASTPRRNTHRTASIGTCVSALSAVSTHAGGPYCYRCALTNRKLQRAMYDLLETNLKNGKKLIDEWAWEAGVSPDHMDCERTKMRVIPPTEDLVRGEDRGPCYRCKTETTPVHGSQSRQISGSRMCPFNGQDQKQLLLTPRQKLNPFTQAAPNTSFGQSSLAAVPQFPRLMSWAVPSRMDMPSIPEQDAAHYKIAEEPGQVAQPQTQQWPYQQQQQQQQQEESRIPLPWQSSGDYPDAQAQHHPIQEQQQPPANQAWAQAPRNTNIFSHTSYSNPFVAIPRTPEAQIPTVQQHPFYPQQLPEPQQPPRDSLVARLGNPFANASGPTLEKEKARTPTVQLHPFYPQQLTESKQPPCGSLIDRLGNPFANSGARILEKEIPSTPQPQTREDAPLPIQVPLPSSHPSEMTIPGMLNGADETQQSAAQVLASSSSAGVDGGGGEASVQVIDQGQYSTGTGVDTGLDRTRKPSSFLNSELQLEEHRQELEDKYCCEVIPGYAGR